MNMPSGKTTFTLAEAAKVLSCHPETLRRAIRNGELQAAQLGRGYRISRHDLQAFWTACGGGELFGKEWESAPETERPPPKKRKKRQTEQLTLPGTFDEQK